MLRRVVQDAVCNYPISLFFVDVLPGQLDPDRNRFPFVILVTNNLFIYPLVRDSVIS